MSQVCHWLNVLLCLRPAPAKRPTGIPQLQMFDAIVVWKESPRESSGGLAYEVTLAEAKRPASPPSPREKVARLSLTKEDIDNKLKHAEVRREDNKAQRLEFTYTDRERMELAKQRASADEEKFRKETAEKAAKDQDEKEKKRLANLAAQVNRLKAHAERVRQIQLANEKYIDELRVRIEQKLVNAEASRKSQLKSLMEKLEEHMNKITEGRRQSEEESKRFSQETEQKMLESLEMAYRKREEQLNIMMQKLKEHERRIEEVRANKPAGDS